MAESTYLEREELPLPVGWTLEPWIDVHQKAIEPIYNTRPLWWIILELEHKLGLLNATFEELEKEVLEQLKVNKEELYSKGAIKVTQEDIYEVYPYKKGLNTPSGRIEIFSETLYKLGYYPILHTLRRT